MGDQRAASRPAPGLMRWCAAALLAALTLTCAAPLAAQRSEGATRSARKHDDGPTPTPVVQIPRFATAHAVVDGRLNEAVWKKAAVITGFHEYQPVDGRPAEERTVVRVWYSPNAIWFGITAYDSDPSSIRATKADRDNIDGEDHVTIFLDTFDDQRRAYFFGVNPLGVQQDGVRSEGGMTAGQLSGGTTDKSPDYWWKSAGHVTDQGYVVEVRIPFKSLRLPGDGPQRWGLQIERVVQRTGHTDTWTAVQRAGESFLAQEGVITGLHGLHRGVVLQAQPFVTGGLDGAVDSTTGAFVRGGPHGRTGINLSLGWSSVTLDGTINPDFSQVEADVGQVTVNERFALFYPEKRPFFLEGIDLFATPNQLVYTRRIVSPIAGVKLTGKVGRNGIAFLSALDHSGGQRALFDVLRLRRDLGHSSTAGLVFTDRSVQGSPDFSRVLAADTRIIFARLYYVEAQLGASWTRDTAAWPVTPPPGAAPGAGAVGRAPIHAAAIWKAELDRTGRLFGLNYSITGIGNDFRADAGYVPRVGIVTGHLFNRFEFYGARGALIQSFTTFFGPTRFWNYSDFGRRPSIEGNDNIHTILQLRGGWNLQAGIQRAFVTLDTANYAGMQVRGSNGAIQPYMPLAKVSGPVVDLQATTPTYQKLDATASVQWGRSAIFPEGSEGNQTTITGQLALRPARWARIFLSGTWQSLYRVRDGSRFALTRIPRLKIEIQPTRAFFFRTVAQWTSERVAALEDATTGAPLLDSSGNPIGAQSSDALRVDLLLSYQPVPGTVAFFGYGSSLNGTDLLQLDGLQRASDGFFVKLAYQIRH